MNRKWTFLITETRVANHRVKVLGHFVFFLHGIDEKKHPRGQETQFSIQYLTKPEEPVEFELPTWFFKESGVNPKSISVDVVEKYLHDLFEDGYDYIPTPPTDIQLHQLPPSYRDAALRIEDKQREQGSL